MGEGTRVDPLKTFLDVDRSARYVQLRTIGFWWESISSYPALPYTALHYQSTLPYPLASQLERSACDQPVTTLVGLRVERD